jgi:TolB-like protein
MKTSKKIGFDFIKKTLLTVLSRVCVLRKNSEVSKLRFEKRLLVVMVLFLLPMMAQAKTFSYSRGIKHIAEDIKTAISDSDVIAFIDFKATNTATIQFTDSVIDDLTNELLEVNKVRMVDRQNIDKIRAEQEYQQSGYVDDASAVEIGRELGATAILLGTGENMVNYYRFRFRLISVETAIILMQSSADVKTNQRMRRLINDKVYRSSGIGTTHWLVGARLGAGKEFNTADEDMVGEGFSPNEESNIVFNAALYGAYRFNDMWSVQPELNFMVNNGMTIDDEYDGYTSKISYRTLDIPLLVRWNFIQSPVVAGLIIGPYISLPISRVKTEFVGEGTIELDPEWFNLGVTGGFAIGYKIGPGYLTADLRFLHDLNDALNLRPIQVREDKDDVPPSNICVRRSLNITIGYEFYL